MSYKAIICKLKDVQSTPLADNFLIANVLGNQVIVDKSQKDGDIGIFFPCDGQLSEEYVKANDLLRITDSTGKKIGGGYFESHRRVKKTKLRKILSDGYFAPLESLSFTKGDITTFKVGDLFDTFNNIPICNKYYTKATRQAMNSAKKGKVKRGETVSFHKHLDTEQFRFFSESIKQGDLLTITLKQHGTSTRIGYHLDEVEPSFWQKIKNNLYQYFTFGRGEIVPKQEWVILNGSRNVILEKSQGKGYYGDDTFREKIVEPFKNLLHKGETVYGEIVGWVGPNTPIMPDCDTKCTEDKAFIKKYGPTISWDYNCLPGTCELYVYRITQTNVDGISVDLSWASVKRRSEELGLKHVLEVVSTFVYDGKEENLRKQVESLTDGEDLINPKACREGVVIRVDSAKGKTYFLKNKSWFFLTMEGVVKDKPDYLDTEEIA